MWCGPTVIAGTEAANKGSLNPTAASGSINVPAHVTRDGLE
jgi:hypothetical protein